MNWLKIPVFLWPLVVSYYGRRLLGIRPSVVVSNWVYFLRMTVPLGFTYRKADRQYQVFNPVMGHTVMMRPASTDVLVYLQIFFNHEYALLNALPLPEKPVIIDLGANAGYFMLFAKSKWPDAQVLCVEPDAGNYEQILRQIKVNCLTGVHTVRAGVWIANEPLGIDSQQNGLEWAYSVYGDTHGNIQGLTLTRLLHDHHINRVDLLKIDIEGTEEKLFEEVSFLETLSNTVCSLIMETHHGEMQKMIADRLATIGFSVTLDRELIFAERIHP